MFRRLGLSILSLGLLLGLWFMQSTAYSYPSSDLEGDMPPAYTYIGSDVPDVPAPDEQPAAAVPATTAYTVGQGDTLFKIARNFDINVDDLIAANPMANPNRLAIGQSLTIPLVGSSVQLADGQSKIIKKVLNTTLTAYTAGVESTGKSASHPMYGITYSGLKAKEGRTIAVDPNIIPLGSTVFIEGIGLRKAEDIGSAIRGTRIDVFMNDLGQAREFGVKKNVKVYLLDRDNA
ncbi:3D domain-containing protein [Paenibacillus ferrarius]|uniref:3D domain-containing protein n=1 Tax=Paenibacillus ferrarius TaxID=1469647 RepID=UPI003D27425C